MDGLVRGMLVVRRAGRAVVGWCLLIGATAWLVTEGWAAAGWMRPTSWGLALALAFYGGVARARASTDTQFGRELKTGLWLVLLVDTVLAQTYGTLDVRAAGAIYVLVACVSAFSRPRVAVAVAIYAVALDAALCALSFGGQYDGLIARAGLTSAVALLHAVALGIETLRLRVSTKQEVKLEIERMHAQARGYRLAGTAMSASEDAEESLTRSSVEEIRQSVFYALSLLRSSMGLHTAVLLWRSSDGKSYRISECATASDDVIDGPIAVGDGVLAVVEARGEPVRLERLKASYRVPYYRTPCPVRALLAVPVRSARGEPIGLLVLDRTDETAFTAGDVAVAEEAAKHCLRAVQNERTFLQLERTRSEQGKLYRAVQELASSMTEKDVIGAGVRAAREIANFDVAAITTFERETGRHHVVAVEADDDAVRGLSGSHFAHNSGLVSMVVQNKFPLPYRGELDATQHVVFARGMAWPKTTSLLVFPLTLRDQTIGTLVLGARRPNAFSSSVRGTLEVLASHLAVSMVNARMVAHLETMATTDGMTGLLNKRAMLEAAAQKVEAARRFGRSLAVIVTDIDHFKRVNDTYGHDVGDQVIKGLGDLLRRQKRSTDVVARFGGEEFVILCEQTDEEGALLLAERVRKELAAMVFPTKKGPLSVTCSLGISTFPDSGEDWDSLFKSADEALYASKNGGRNRVTSHRAPRSLVRMRGEPVSGRRKTGS